MRWSDGGLMEFIGRADDQVKINGHRIELGEIESQLLRHIVVAEAAVTARRNTDGSTSLAAYVVAHDANVPLDVDELRGFLAVRLPAYMLPASFTVLPAMPLTPNGKLDRKALPIVERTSRSTYAEPATPLQRKLSQLWRQILKLERIGIYDNFFELGGDR